MAGATRSTASSSFSSAAGTARPAERGPGCSEQLGGLSEGEEGEKGGAKGRGEVQEKEVEKKRERKQEK